MQLKFVRVIAVVISLVVPVQGMAAVTAGLCCMAFGHHEDVSLAQEGHDHAAHSHADEGVGHASVADSADGKGAHCGPCTACCASASIAGTLALPLLSAPSHSTYALSQSPPLGIQPSGLYRPPLAL